MNRRPSTNMESYSASRDQQVTPRFYNRQVFMVSRSPTSWPNECRSRFLKTSQGKTLNCKISTTLGGSPASRRNIKTSVVWAELETNTMDQGPLIIVTLDKCRRCSSKAQELIYHRLLSFKGRISSLTMANLMQT